MNRKYLADQGFTPEQIEVIMGEHGRTISRYVPKSELETVNGQLAALNTQLTEARSKIVDPKDIDALKAQAAKVTTLESQVADLTAKNSGIQKQADAKLKLFQAKVKDPDLLLPKIDLEKDIDEQLKGFQTSHPYLFGDPVPNNPNPNPAGGAGTVGQEAEIAAFKKLCDETSLI
ncbi:MAG: phage scaffolding protein [Negativicutes bacterium]|nr:phage scaffolding protein [Negativicutes bacterium]